MCLMVAAMGLLSFIGIAPASTPKREAAVASLPLWTDFMARQTKALESLSACEQDRTVCSPEMERWANLIQSLRGENRLRQIITVNRWFNRQTYKYDEYAYQTLDHWADTGEFLAQRGDCEDYALAKYFTLRQLGFTAEELKITVVYDSIKYLNHAVLMVYMDKTRYMLDMNSDSTDPDPMDYRYQTVYTFNENKAWFY